MPSPSSPRRPFVGGNWKMNTTAAAARTLADELAQIVARERLDDRCDIAVFPPFVYIRHVHTILREHSSAIALGAQDCYHQPDGAFTGEVSIAMLKDCGVSIVLTGHSERRHIIGESDELVNLKTRAVLEGGLSCILCIGETLAQREAGQTDAVNARQLRAGLAVVKPEQMSRIVIAYEPVWAIGTGKNATPEQAQEAHHKVRAALAELYGETVAQATRIIYGGSATAANVPKLIACPDIDGGLVGGASLKPPDFLGIVRVVGNGG